MEVDGKRERVRESRETEIEGGKRGRETDREH